MKILAKFLLDGDYEEMEVVGVTQSHLRCKRSSGGVCLIGYASIHESDKGKYIEAMRGAVRSEA